MFLFLTILSVDVLDSKENIFFNDELRVLMEVDWLVMSQKNITTGELASYSEARCNIS